MSGKLVVLLFSSIIFVLSCNTTEPPPGETITLTLEDASSIEAWINLTTSNLQLPASLTLKQSAEGGDQTRSTINLVNSDTLIYLDSLLPNQQYTFEAITQSSNQSIISNELRITTMDTTSHNFTWQSWTFGDNISNTLDDVVIIDENNIWVVGEIYLNDSLGQADAQPYAVAHWNGTDWTLMKVPYHDFNQTVKHPGPLFSIVVISGEIYVASYANLLKLTGSDWEEKAFFMEQIPFDGQVLKMWGIDQNNIYCVGRNGAIYYYFGVDWQKIESGTDVDIQDIWGTTNNTSEPLMLCAVSNVLEPGEHKILSINTNNQIDSIEWVSDRGVHSTWFTGSSKLFACGAGVFIRSDEINWVEQTELPLTFTRRIRGTANNDVFVAGDFGLVAHFNGSSWKEYSEAGVALFYSLDYKGNIMAAVGERDGKGVVLMMRRE